jgi:hypothetical protein
MTATAILFVLLASGEADNVTVDVDLCRRVPAALASGNAVSVDLDSGRKEIVVAATCFTLPGPIGACDWETS